MYAAVKSLNVISDATRSGVRSTDVPKTQFPRSDVRWTGVPQTQFLRSGVRWMDASRRFPFTSESVDKIYCSHFLEHIPPDKGKHVLKECYRVLKKDSIMRLVVPDLIWHAERYVAQTKEVLKKSVLPESRGVHDKFLNTLYGAYLKKKRYGAEHCYMYDLPTLVAVLKSAGFLDIRKCEFQKGIDDELIKYDTRSEDSLHIEITK